MILNNYFIFEKKDMHTLKKTKTLLATLVLLVLTNLCMAQHKMDSDKRTLRNANNATVGKIDSDGKTIRNANNKSLGKVDSDGKTIRNANNATVLKLDGKDIRNSNNSIVGKMSDVTKAIKGAKEDAVHVALWWFIVQEK